jgi:cell division protein FtsQ
VLTGIAADAAPGLPLVTGKGAGSAVAELVNHLEAVPGIRSKMTAAGRVGERRWNLYFTGPVKVLLPESGLEEALAVLSDLDDRHRMLDRKVAVIDLRVAGAAVLSPPLPTPVEGPVNVAGMSQR